MYDSRTFLELPWLTLPDDLVAPVLTGVQAGRASGRRSGKTLGAGAGASDGRETAVTPLIGV